VRRQLRRITLARSSFQDLKDVDVGGGQRIGDEVACDDFAPVADIGAAQGLVCRVDHAW
jgi:hypothetical protein